MIIAYFMNNVNNKNAFKATRNFSYIMSKKGLNEDDLAGGAVELLFSMNSAHQWNDREPAADFSAIPLPTEYYMFSLTSTRSMILYDGCTTAALYHSQYHYVACSVLVVEQVLLYFCYSL